MKYWNELGKQRPEDGGRLLARKGHQRLSWSHNEHLLRLPNISWVLLRSRPKPSFRCDSRKRTSDPERGVAYSSRHVWSKERAVDWMANRIVNSKAHNRGLNCIVLFGNGSNSNMKGHAATPRKRIATALASRALVCIVSEYI